MKKIKSFFCVMLLTTCLVGNVFASGSGGSGIFSFFESFMNAIVSFVSTDDSCPLRQCQNCRPVEEGDNDPNCRPTEN